MANPDDYFVGWRGQLPAAHAGFLRRLLLVVCLGFVALGVALAVTIDDPGGGAGVGGEQALRGVLTVRPYPTLTLAPDLASTAGHVILLSGPGKGGPVVEPALDGRTVVATGFMLRRGGLEMLQVTEPIRAADRPIALPASGPVATPLGRWAITGEICDGKCYAGAMRPGRGIAHRPCANLCITGEVPPVFVTTAPVEGSSTLLLGAPDGGRLAPGFRAQVGITLRLEGALERRGDLLVFRPDLARARLP